MTFYSIAACTVLLCVHNADMVPYCCFTEIFILNKVRGIKISNSQLLLTIITDTLTIYNSVLFLFWSSLIGENLSHNYLGRQRCRWFSILLNCKTFSSHSLHLSFQNRLLNITFFTVQWLIPTLEVILITTSNWCICCSKASGC